VVDEVIEKIKNGTITGYAYNPKTASLTRATGETRLSPGLRRLTRKLEWMLRPMALPAGVSRCPTRDLGVDLTTLASAVAHDLAVMAAYLGG